MRNIKKLENDIKRIEQVRTPADIQVWLFDGEKHYSRRKADEVMILDAQQWAEYIEGQELIEVKPATP